MKWPPRKELSHVLLAAVLLGLAQWRWPAWSSRLDVAFLVYGNWLVFKALKLPHSMKRIRGVLLIIASTIAVLRPGAVEILVIGIISLEAQICSIRLSRATENPSSSS